MTALASATDFDMPNWVGLALANGPISGSEIAGGIHTAGDVLVDKTADGVPLDKLWDTLRDLLGVWRAKQDATTALLAFETTDVAEAIPQTLGKFQFEEASEFGVPKAAQAGDSLIIGYGFHDYDLATRYTWKYLRDATARQVEHDMNAALEADQRLRSGKILGRVMSPTQRLTPEGNPEFGLFNGSDSVAPLEFMGNTFDASHTHYLVSGNATLDSGDIEDSINLITEHGYGTTPGSRILVFCNQAEADRIAGWRAGEESRAPVNPETSGPIAKFDFIPSVDAPAYLTSESIVGDKPPSDVNGLVCVGSYGRALILPTVLLPAGYVLTVASSGPNSPQNAVGFREHINPAYRGMRQIPGKGVYPLVDMFYQRSFGVGVRHRGAAVAMQIKASGSYVAPTIAV